MLNVGGYQSYLNPTGNNVKGKYDPKKPQGPGKKNDGAQKKDNSDKTDFSALGKQQGTQSTANTYGKMRVGKTNEKTSELSKTAQNYLEKLKKKYGNMDFIIADYSTDEEADKLLSTGKGEYNVLITPDLLEKMASDDEEAAKYEALIDQSVEDIKSVKTGLGEDADMVEKFGVSVDSDGNYSIHAKLIEDLTGSDGSNTVKGNTVEEMLSRLNEAKEANADKIAKLREQKKAEAEKTDETEETTANTDDVDKEISKLNDSKKQILAQLKTVSSDKEKAELMDKLREVESQLAHKDNENYRKAHAKYN